MSFVITDTSPVFSNPVAVAAPAAGTNPLAVTATSTPVQVGGVGVTYATVAAAAGQTQQVVLSGAATRLNLAQGAAKVQVIGGGNIVEAAQTANDSSKVISLGDNTVAYNGVTVDTAKTVAGNSGSSPVSVATAAGNQGPAAGFAYYAHGGTGADQIEGSSQSDFIRGGAGNDNINGFGGNDLIRGGAGSDTIALGTGADTVYYTVDQIDGSTDTITDFTTGTDKIAVDRSQVASTASITGLGTNTVVLNGASGRVTVVSQNNAINAGDINFI
jgi:Ca2+-binding RTX toxin-like protein